MLKQVEIPYSEIGEISFEDGWIGPGKRLLTLNFLEPQPRWELKSQEDGGRLITLESSEPLRLWAQKYRELPLTSKASLTIHSREGQKKIKLDRSVDYFEAFCHDLLKRHQLALERYQGYAKGTTLRQPERHLQTREALCEQGTTRQLKS